MNTVKTAALMVALMLLLVGLGGAIAGERGMILFFVLSMGGNLISYWFSDKIVLRMYGAKEVTEAEAPVLYSVTHELSVRMNLPMPRVYIIPSDGLNAFATGRNPNHAAVAATEGILRVLTREELTGVMAHELSHVGNRDILIGTIAAAIAGAIGMLAHIAQFAAIFGGGRRDGDREGGNPLVLLLMAIVASVAAGLIQMAISRSREFEADASGARACGNPMWLASALRKLEAGAQRIPVEATPATAHMFIVNPLRGGGVAKFFSTHPPMEERIARLETMAYGRTVSTPDRS